MIETKEIEIRIENQAEIEAMLAAVNSKARAHTFTSIDQIIQLSKQAEKALDKMGLDESMRKGAKYCAESSNPVAKSYKNKRIGTIVMLARDDKGWALSSVEATWLYPNQGGKRKLFVADKAV